MGRDTPAQFRSVVRGRLCKSIGRSWTRFSRGHAANGGRRARWRCRRIAAGDRPRSTAQPRSALTGVVGPNRPGGQPIRCCHSPNKLAKGSPPVSGTCRSALSDVSGATDGWRNAAKPFAGHGSASPGRQMPRSRADPTGGPHGLNQSAVNWQSWTRKLVLSTCRAPYDFRFVAVQWQSVYGHLVRSLLEVHGRLDSIQLATAPTHA